jgi:hypothetical protein
MENVIDILDVVGCDSVVILVRENTNMRGRSVQRVMSAAQMLKIVNIISRHRKGTAECRKRTVISYRKRMDWKNRVSGMHHLLISVTVR